MTLNGNQLAAILKSGLSMVIADGVVKGEEELMLIQNLAKFNVPADHASALLQRAQDMKPVEMFEALTGLSIEAKKYVCGYWATISAIDGDIDDKEIAMWRLLCTLSNFPTMNFKEALEFWGNH